MFYDAICDNGFWHGIKRLTITHKNLKRDVKHKKDIQYH